MPRIQTQDYCMEDSCAIHYTNNACMSLMVINNLSIIVTYYVSYIVGAASEVILTSGLFSVEILEILMLFMFLSCGLTHSL